jgi:hypothetical protein
VDTDYTPSDDNEGIEAMDDMENRLAMMGLGETGYLVMTGAACAGASSAEAFDVIVAFYVAGMIANRITGEDDEETPSS